MLITYSGLADTVSGKLQNNNIYTIAKRNVEGQDMLYQSLKLTNGIWILAELRIQPGNPNYTVEDSTLSNQLLLFSHLPSLCFHIPHDIHKVYCRTLMHGNWLENKTDFRGLENFSSTFSCMTKA